MFVYDDSESSNVSAFRRLPVFFQDYITGKHSILRNRVIFACKDQGKNFRFTSGFRSQEVNSKVGGVSDSLHLFGLAVDFVSKNFDVKRANEISSDVVFIDEKKHIHCQFIRGC